MRSRSRQQAGSFHRCLPPCLASHDRIALVPMKDHVFALAQFQNLGYVAIYFGLLALRYR
jgi:hypothetical protein